MGPNVGADFGVKEQRDLCQRERDGSPEIGPFGHTLFPDQTFTIDVPVYIPPETMDAPRPEKGSRLKLFGPIIVGCVSYKFTFVEGYHQTGFILALRRRDPNSPAGRIFPVEDGEIPMADLILTPSYVGSFADQRSNAKVRVPPATRGLRTNVSSAALRSATSVAASCATTSQNILT
jgi:hypothetical protein